MRISGSQNRGSFAKRTADATGEQNSALSAAKVVHILNKPSAQTGTNENCPKREEQIS